MEVANTLAYYNAAKITKEKSFIVQVHMFYKNTERSVYLLKPMEVANTLAYYNAAKITEVKSFIKQVHMFHKNTERSVCLMK
jgi:hypothetical protein